MKVWKNIVLHNPWDRKKVENNGEIRSEHTLNFKMDGKVTVKSLHWTCWEQRSSCMHCSYYVFQTKLVKNQTFFWLISLTNSDHLLTKFGLFSDFFQTWSEKEDFFRTLKSGFCQKNQTIVRAVLRGTSEINRPFVVIGQIGSLIYPFQLNVDFEIGF